jgi:glycosyltransferase involved in cell wall biosynthesis
LVFQTEGERELVERLFPVASHPQLLLGLGVSPLPGDEQGFRERSGVGNRPYVLCLGRIDDGKGARIAATYFAEYKKRRPGPLALAFAGPVVQPPDPHPDIVVAGIVTYEAFSLALIEGWAAGTPALVNAACLATREHVERSSGGLWFDGYLAFESALDRLLGDELLHAGMASAGNRYVENSFRWPALIDRYGAFLQRIATR